MSDIQSYLLVFTDGSVAYNETKAGKEPTEFLKLQAELGAFEAIPFRYEDLPDEHRAHYRSAWTYKGGKIVINMERAKEAHRNRIRAARKALLAALDVQFMRALEAGQDTKAITEEKTRLRNATDDPRIDAAQTIDELKAVWPL